MRISSLLFSIYQFFYIRFGRFKYRMIHRYMAPMRFRDVWMGTFYTFMTGSTYVSKETVRSLRDLLHLFRDDSYFQLGNASGDLVWREIFRTGRITVKGVCYSRDDIIELSKGPEQTYNRFILDFVKEIPSELRYGSINLTGVDVMGIIEATREVLQSRKTGVAVA